MKKALAVVVMVVCFQSLVLAAGGSKRDENASGTALEKEASAHYNKGLKFRDKAWKHEKKAASAKNDNVRNKHEQAARAAYEKALVEFRAAVEKDPKLYQAYSSLGYAYRKTGDYKQALQAYDRSLALKPDYAPAIEYRAEAFLGLNRIDAARRAYEQLRGLSPEHAAELLDAMERWVKTNKEKPTEGIQPELVQELEMWLDDTRLRQKATKKNSSGW